MKLSTGTPPGSSPSAAAPSSAADRPMAYAPAMHSVGWAARSMLALVLVGASGLAMSEPGGQNPQAAAPRTQPAPKQEDTEATARQMEQVPVGRRDELRQLAQRADERAAARLDQMEASLRRNWSKFDDRTRRQTRTAIDAARREQVQFRAEMNRMDSNSSAAWADVRAGMVTAYRELEKAVNAARKEFGESGESATQKQPATR